MASRLSAVSNISTRSSLNSEPEVNETFKTGIEFPTIHIPSPTFRTIGPPTTGDQELYKLPPVVNFVALRETFLSEAPFVKRTNRAFWKKWIDSKQYTQSFAVLLRYITNCINDNGAINVGRLYDVEDNILIDKLSSNVAEMLTLERDYLRPSAAHDILFSRLPEVFAYMIINSLLSTLPKLARVYYSGQFRELLLDWLSELIGGVRLTHPRTDRDWLFHDANDIGIVLVNQGSMRQNRLPGGANTTGNTGTSTPNKSGSRQMNTTSAFSMFQNTAQSSNNNTNSNDNNGASLTATKRVSFLSSPGNGDNDAMNTSSTANSPTASPVQMTRKKTTASTSTGPKISFFQAVLAAQKEDQYQKQHDMSRFSKATSAFVLENSPLVRMHLSKGRNEDDIYRCQHPLHISLSHLPDRPLFSLQPSQIIKEGTFREKKIDKKRLTHTLKSSVKKREQILKDYQQKESEMKKDLQRMKHAYQIQLDLLNKKPVSQKQLLAAATTLEAAKVSSQQATDDDDNTV
eukprot:gene26445-31960_t